MITIINKNTAPHSLRDRIGAAFDELKEDGYFAEMDWWCCQSCGVAAIPEAFAERYVFHDQDAADIREKTIVTSPGPVTAFTYKSGSRKLG
jgi:hypothetical protein